jgi:predicted TIM-barrel fold metal-dependent hydrolase
MQKIDIKIEKDISKRLPAELKTVLEKGVFKFDVHCHLFNKDFIPDKYFGLRMPFLVNTDFLMYTESLLDTVSLDDDDKLSHYAYFIDFIAKNTTKDIAEHLIVNSPPNTIFCPLMMDFQPGIDGKTKKTVFQQLDELREVRNLYPDKFLPFVGINPNNSKHKELFEKAFSPEYNFYGVKIYPSLGYMPSHPALMDIFEICSHYDIPVTTHCGSGTVHTHNNILRLKYFILNEKGELILKKEKKTFLFKKQFEKYFNRPQNWQPVLKAFPNLRLNLAHFGGDSEWDNKESNDKEWTFRTIDLMERYENVYSDVSYIIHLPEMHQKFKTLFYNNQLVAERTLMGTDFYMILIEGKYKDIMSRFVAEMDSKILQKIAIENPLKFLNLSQLITQETKEKWQQIL